MRTKTAVVVVFMLALVTFFGNQRFSIAAERPYGYLIISVVSENTLKPLIDYRASQGLEVTFVKHTDIDDVDDPISIRDYIKDRMEELNLRYVLFVGRHKTLPMLTAVPDSSISGHDMVNDTETDFFYATPNAIWDKDGDGRLGELTDDGVMAHEPELFVGRIPFDDDKIVSNIVTRTIEFDSMTDAEKSRCLFPGSLLGYKGQMWEGKRMERGDGADFSEMIYNDFFRDSGFSRFRQYESEGLLPAPYVFEEPVSDSTLSSRFPENFGLVCWTGHGSPERVVRTIWYEKPGGVSAPEEKNLKQPKLIHSSDVKSSTLRWGIVMAASCSTSNPRREYNLGAACLAAGAVGYVGSTGVAWGPSYWRTVDDGGMNTVYYLFAKNISQTGTTTGEAMANSLYEYAKDYFWGDTEDPPEASQMNIFNYNLYGDPAVTLVRGDQSPRLVVDEPSTYSYPGGTAVWEGKVTGEIGTSFKAQVIPGQMDMAWAVPKIDIEDGRWKIEIEISKDAETGERQWILMQTDSGARVKHPLILKVHARASQELLADINPQKLAPYRHFKLTFSTEGKLSTSNMMLKYDPFRLELIEIFDASDESTHWDFIDNYMGMARITTDGDNENNLIILEFRPRAGFGVTELSVPSIYVADERGTTIISKPVSYGLTMEESEVWRSRADFDHSGYVDDTDLCYITTNLGLLSDGSLFTATLDINMDGVIDMMDYSLALSRLSPEESYQ
ncbi:MAG TPA: C25 family cysteine peptidase [Caldisericia bacterium]|nr:C25 family cysteine peptidase [Caldisericia bacterium]HPF49088.1 C25 family cysteine peptidase [Caldisericia bacterium]HPI83048.1 C25 family cysteine peptidase [Caldisericia bacterium]HPQ92275.1 C25 family cysteine peptidase [Caldisericia bacterium]HRV74627.1 C25 family cysteine peptidase [Caldisericia bacterium]